MKDYTFKVPQDIVFGMGSLKRLPELLEKCGSKKILWLSKMTFCVKLSR